MPAMTMEYEIPETVTAIDFKRGDSVVFKINKDLDIVSIKTK